MELVKLNKVCDIGNGFAFKSESYQDSGIPLLRISNIINGTVSFKDDSICVEENFLKTKSDFIVEKGDVVIALSGATTGKFGVYNLAYPSFLNQRIGIIKFNNSKNLDSKYFYHYLNILQSQILNKAGGAAQPNISTKEIGEFQIPLPTLSEQKRIADLLDTADSLRQKDKVLLKKYDQLAQSLFLDMFGDPVKNEKGWEFKNLEKLLIQKTQNGHYATKDEYDEKGIEMVHMSDAFYHRVIPGKLKRVRCDNQTIEKYSLNTEDILISRRSLTYDGACKPCFISVNNQPLIYESSLIRVSVNPKLINHIFLFYFLSNDQARSSYILKHVTKSTISGINNKGLNAIEIYLPTISLQNQFAEQIQLIEKQKELAKKNLEKSEELFGALMGEVFK